MSRHAKVILGLCWGYTEIVEIVENEMDTIIVD